MGGWGGSLGGFQNPKNAAINEARAVVRALLHAIQHEEGCSSYRKEACNCMHHALVKRALTLLAKER